MKTENDIFGKSYLSGIPAAVRLGKGRPYVRLLLWAIVLGAILVSITACQEDNIRSDTSERITEDSISKAQLREALNNFEEYFRTTVTDLADEMDRLNTTPVRCRMTLEMRHELITACSTMLEQDDPLKAFIDSWVFVVRLSRFFESSHGIKCFGENQSIAVEAVHRLENRIELTGKMLLDKQLFNTTKQNVQTFAAANPLKDSFTGTVVFPSEIEKENNPFHDVIALPLLPLHIAEGVAGQITGVNRLSDSARRFSDVVEGLPESTRWQLLMFLYDFEKYDSVKTLVGGFSQVANSSERLAETVAPEQVSQYLQQANTQLTDAADHISTNLTHLTNLIARRLAELIVLVLLLALGYRVITTRIGGTPKQNHRSNGKAINVKTHYNFIRGSDFIRSHPTTDRIR